MALSSGLKEKIGDRQLNYGRNLIEKFFSNCNNVKRVVDIGAGKGSDLLAVRKLFPDCELVGLESYAPYQEILRENGITVINFDIEHGSIPYPDGSVDLIICNQILEHCKEIWWFIHEVTRVLKVGGSLIVGVPNLASLHNRLLLMFGEQPTSIQNNTAHVRGYTKKDFVKFMDSGFPGGYKLEGFGGGNFYPLPAFLAKPMASLLPKMAVGIFFHFKKIKEYSLNGYITYPIEKQLETKFYLGN